MPGTSGAAASISNPSPAMTSIPGRGKVFSTLASSSAALVDTSVAVGARCRSLTTTTRLPRPTSSRMKSGTSTEAGAWSAPAVLLPSAGRPPPPRVRQRGRGLEPLLLRVGVVELAVAVGQLPAPDDQLKAVGEGGVLAGLAGQRRDLGGVVVDEHRAQGLTHQDLVVELEDQLARPPRRLVVGAVRVAHPAQLGHGHARVHPLAEFFLQQVEEVAARPRRGQVDLLAAEVELEPADGPP